MYQHIVHHLRPPCLKQTPPRARGVAWIYNMGDLAGRHTSEAEHVFRQAYDPSPDFKSVALTPPSSEWSGDSEWGAWYSRRNHACRTFIGASVCGIESDMWAMARALIRPWHTVLEHGARYGTTSCVLSEATNNSGRVVSVEPDTQVHASLYANRQSHLCNFGIFRGTVGRMPQMFVAPAQGRNVSYEQRTRDAAGASASNASGAAIAHLGFEALERLTRLRFNALVIDCEGCLEDVLTSHLLDRTDPPLELILLEMDVLRKVNYAGWHHRLTAHGFTRIWRLEDSLFGTRAPQHAAYHRGSAGGAPPPTCHEYALRQRHWPRCRHEVKRDRDALVCGSRLTCLNPQLSNGTRDRFWVKYHRKKVLLAGMNSTLRAAKWAPTRRPQAA